jgi:hypothetical protein
MSFARLSSLSLAIVVTGTALAAQPVPQPFPRPKDEPRTSTPQEPREATTRQSPPPSGPAARPALPEDQTQPEPVPSEELLGVPVYPNAHFLRSYDAGMGQRYYLFGSTASFAELMAYYRNALRTRGDVVFEEPPVHIFEVGRFREESMVFPPSVTLKDYTWGGMEGWLDPRPGAQPQRYPTVIQIVPVPPADRR